MSNGIAGCNIRTVSRRKLLSLLIHGDLRIAIMVTKVVLIITVL